MNLTELNPAPCVSRESFAALTTSGWDWRQMKKKTNGGCTKKYTKDLLKPVNLQHLLSETDNTSIFLFNTQ